MKPQTKQSPKPSQSLMDQLIDDSDLDNESHEAGQIRCSCGHIDHIDEVDELTGLCINCQEDGQ